jgi:YcxB-like protein
METASPELAFEYQLTEDDYVNACTTHCRNAGLGKKLLSYTLPFVGVASIILGAATARSLSREGEDWTLSLVFVVVGISWLICHFIRPWRMRRSFRRDPRFKTPTKVVIGGSEWRVTTATTEALFKHGTFVKAVETDSLFLLYHSSIMFNVIPKRDVTPDQQVQIASFLDRELPVQKGRVRLPATS